MKNLSKQLLFCITSLLLLIIACGSPTSENGEGSGITINGMVVDRNEGPIENAIVRIIEPSPERSTTTNAEGIYNFEVTVDSSETYVIEARKEGYPTKQEEVLAIPDRDIEMPNFKLAETDPGDGDDENGEDDTPPQDSEGSAYIELNEVSKQEISVNGAGGIETTDFTFTVTDSAGTPVSNTNAVYVRFEILEGPNGGESIYPDSVLTQNGKATATLKSGSASGVVQVQASFIREETNQAKKTTVNAGNKNNQKPDVSLNKKGAIPDFSTYSSSSTESPVTSEVVTHSSKPVQVVITGGLPSLDHFDISIESKNVVAASTNHTNPITVHLGDKYGNDALPGTSVKFFTDKGTIDDASVNDNGYANTVLKTHNVSPGLGTVEIETIDENSQTIGKEVNVMFSGTPTLSVPQNTTIQNALGQTFTFTLTDENGNPLSAGTSVSISVDNDNLSLEGNTDVTLDGATQAGSGTTEFEFTVSKKDEQPIYEDGTITITADGPNGSTSEQITLTAPDAPDVNAGSITLASVSQEEIGVVSTGQTEQTQLTFQVSDSTGNPLDLDNKLDVSFRLGNSPAGADVSPKSVSTDDNGQATTTLTSGTNAGVAQVIAEATVNETTISSKPIAVTIEAGLPVQSNFTFKVADGTKNMVAESGDKTQLKVWSGDKHGNPVPEGTPIAFSTDNGIVTANSQTNTDGETTVTYTASGSAGEATITAETADMNEQAVTDQVQIMLSGAPQILNLPASPIDLTNFTSQTIDYTLADLNGNPLAAGTSVNVSVNNSSLSVNGDTDVTLDEAFNTGNGTTDFQFTLSNPTGDPIYEGGTITITADGPNGSASEQITLTAPDAPEINPGHITLVENGISNNEIGVINTGQTEQTQLTFQVTDSTGRPLDLDNQTDVSFSLGASPGGGEDVYPKTVTTDANGQATTTLTSGTDAGVAQVLAEITAVDGTPITSQPVQIAIHAGLPDQDHFTVKSSPTNVYVGGDGTPKVGVTAYTGDKHGNIVPEGTTIYFTTDGGYISGSGQTNSEGEATATLTAANPIPGDGIATITAETADDNNVAITTTTEVTFSGAPNITLNPDPFTINDGDKEDFTYTVTDGNNNAMPIGTTIEVEAVGGDFELEDPNDGEVTIGSSNDTQFGFTVYDTDPGNVTDDTFYITITVTIPPHEGQESETVIKETFTGTKAKTK